MPALPELQTCRFTPLIFTAAMLEDMLLQHVVPCLKDCVFRSSRLQNSELGGNLLRINLVPRKTTHVCSTCNLTQWILCERVWDTVQIQQNNRVRNVFSFLTNFYLVICGLRPKQGVQQLPLTKISWGKSPFQLILRPTAWKRFSALQDLECLGRNPTGWLDFTQISWQFWAER